MLFATIDLGVELALARLAGVRAQAARLCECEKAEVCRCSQEGREVSGGVRAGTDIGKTLLRLLCIADGDWDDSRNAWKSRAAAAWYP